MPKVCQKPLATVLLSSPFPRGDCIVFAFLNVGSIERIDAQDRFQMNLPRSKLRGMFHVQLDGHVNSVMRASVGKSNMLIIGTVMNADAPRRDVLKAG